MMLVPGLNQVNLGKGYIYFFHWESYFDVIQLHESLFLQFWEFGSGICWLYFAVYRF